MTDQPLDHNGECTYCDEQAMHRVDCPWLLALEHRARDAEARVVLLMQENDRLTTSLHEVRERKEQRITELVQQLTAPCPVCGEPFTIEHLTEHLKAKDEEIARLRERLGEIVLESARRLAFLRDEVAELKTSGRLLGKMESGGSE